MHCVDAEVQGRYYSEKASELKSGVLQAVRSRPGLTSIEIKAELSRELREFLDYDRPRFLDAVLDALLRDGLLITVVRSGQTTYEIRF